MQSRAARSMISLLKLLKTVIKAGRSEVVQYPRYQRVIASRSSRNIIAIAFKKQSSKFIDKADYCDPLSQWLWLWLTPIPYQVIPDWRGTSSGSGRLMYRKNEPAILLWTRSGNAIKCHKNQLQGPYGINFHSENYNYQSIGFPITGAWTCSVPAKFKACRRNCTLRTLRNPSGRVLEHRENYMRSIDPKGLLGEDIQNLPSY